MGDRLTRRMARKTRPRPRVADPDLGFGQVFTDHMLVMDYARGTGWHDAWIEPYRPMSVDAAAFRDRDRHPVWKDGGFIRLDDADMALRSWAVYGGRGATFA